jgi:hypothetical protein
LTLPFDHLLYIVGQRLKNKEDSSQKRKESFVDRAKKTLDSEGEGEDAGTGDDETTGRSCFVGVEKPLDEGDGAGLEGVRRFRGLMPPSRFLGVDEGVESAD